MESEAISSYRNAAYNFYKWRSEAGFVYNLILAFAFAGLTGLGANLKIYLPFTPVPVTGQSFFVLLSAVAIGKYAGLSQIIYASLGAFDAFGLPWFAAAKQPLKFDYGNIIFGPTAGYIAGFIIAAFVLGWLIDNSLSSRSLWYQISLISFGTAIIYASGAYWLSIAAKMSLKTAILKGVLPFLPGDVVKGAGVVLYAHLTLPKSSYNGELEIKNEKYAGRLKTLGAALSLIGIAFFLVLFFVEITAIKEGELGMLKKLVIAYLLPISALSFSLVKLARK